MKYFFLIIVCVVSNKLPAQKKFDTIEIAYSHFKANFRLLEGRNYNDEEYVYRMKTFNLLGNTVLVFHSIDVFNVKKNIFMRILEIKNQLDNKLLFNAMLDSQPDSLPIIDSILNLYLHTTDIDSLIPYYFLYNTKIDMYKNYPLMPFNTCIVAFGNNSQIYYKLLGYEINDFELFYNLELRPKLGLTNSNYKKDEIVLNRLKELSSQELKLDEMYMNYIRRRSKFELFPIQRYQLIR